VQAGNRRTLGEYRGNIFFFCQYQWWSEEGTDSYHISSGFWNDTGGYILNAVQPFFYSTAEEAVFRALGGD